MPTASASLKSRWSEGGQRANAVDGHRNDHALADTGDEVLEHGQDESWHRPQLPEAVCFPESTAEVQVGK